MTESNRPEVEKAVTPRWRRRLTNLALTLVSIAVALVLCEFLARLVFDPVDHLSPRLVRDDILGIRLPPKSGGHDKWGFRNPKVPEQADIVAIGDSHTYGNTAMMKESWPQVLANLTGKGVYNLGMGGYGPNQYRYLLEERALQLQPEIVVCGLYMGDDFDNAFRITYGLDHWARLRKMDYGDVDPDIWEKQGAETNPPLQKRVRIWLSEHSVLYRIVIHGILGGAKGKYQMENASDLFDNVATLDVPEDGIHEAFLPVGVLRGLDQENAGVREGMRITMQLLREMDALCRERGIRFVIALIPTKETVFAPHLEGREKLPMSETIDRLIADERSARAELLQKLDSLGIDHVDALEAMRTAAGEEGLYYDGPADMHPNANGYRVIAEVIAGHLQSQGPPPPGASPSVP